MVYPIESIYVKLKMLDIQSVGIKKSEGEPALLTKTSLLICACLETVIDLVRMRTIRPSVFLFPPSVERSSTAEGKRACSRDETGFNEFLVGDAAGM